MDPARTAPSGTGSEALNAAAHITAPAGGADAAAIHALPAGQELDRTSLASFSGFRDSFLEQRFTGECGIDVADLAKRGVLTFLSKVTHVDEYYLLRTPAEGLPAGLYRIRNEGGAEPFVTVKEQGDGNSQFSVTTDIVSPGEECLKVIRSQGRLVSVIEKERHTYRLKSRPDCLLNQDSVRGLGDFVDLKADSTETMREFLEALKPAADKRVEKSYRELKEEEGISDTQLKVWQFHEKFKDYIMGVVSGTLTPLGFLCATLASTQSKAAMVIALLSAGLTDGMSDSVAASQTSQSSSGASKLEQAGLFLKTMAGKCIVPCCFIPLVLSGDSNLAIGAASVGLASGILAGTAAVQAIAKERPVMPAVAALLGWGAATTIVGTTLGKVIPGVLEAFLGR